MPKILKVQTVVQPKILGIIIFVAVFSLKFVDFILFINIDFFMDVTKILRF